MLWGGSIPGIADKEASMKVFCTALLCVLCASVVSALEPPRPGELSFLREHGLLQGRLDFANKLGNWKMRWSAPGVREASTRGIPTAGTSRMFLLLADFPDYPHTISASVIQNAMFGAGDASNFPYESLHSYYERSSYGKLDIEGAVLGWYRAQHPRGYYTDQAEVLIEEAIAYFKGKGQDFSQFDNDGDGMIDYFALYWTGPDEGWSSFWWGWNGWFGDGAYTVDGKRLGNFSWMWEEAGASTIIHETGHSLGLPDYYDYDDTIGPRGGVGGLDIMDGWGDHNGFSKWVLGWLTPTVVSSTAAGIQLAAAETSPAVIVARAGLAGDTPFDEYFVIQNRQRIGNDKDLPADGLLIFHVDARTACGGFLYDNSYTEHKLLRIMEADGKEEIEQGKGGDAGDFYRVQDGTALTPVSQPDSDLYAGHSSGLWVNHLSSIGRTLQADFTIAAPAALPEVQVRSPRDGAEGVEVGGTIAWDNVHGNAGYALEIHWNLNPLLRATVGPDVQSFTLPRNVVQADTPYHVWIKALGDGVAHGTGDFSRTFFITGCAGEKAWMAKSFADYPCSVYMGAFAYDQGTGRGILYGGNAGTLTGEYDGSGWSSFSTSPAPPYRWYTTAAYDPINNGILLFGGWNFDTSEAYGDTWLYRPATHAWTLVAPSGAGPWPDWAARMTTDPSRGVVVLYQPGDTWEWNGATWAELPDAQTPELYYTDIAYDPASGAVLLFGAWGEQGPIRETWIFRDGRWAQASPGNAPSARSSAELYTDPTTGHAMVFGGDDGSTAFGDLWRWTGNAWVMEEICSTMPAGLWGPAGDFDARRGTFMVLSSGNPVWELTRGLPGHSRPVAPPQ
jgi:M6 family metalloprotease-like protein